MLLRSSSTPVVQSHLSDSPNRDFDSINHHNNKHLQAHDHCCSKFPFIHAGHRRLNLRSFSCNSSPISHSGSGFFEFDPKPNSPCHRAFRRARSDGNLEGLASTSFDLDEFCNSNTSRSLHRHHKSMLHSAPSFSIFNSEDGFEEDERELESDGCLVRSVTIEASIEAIGSDEFSFGKKTMGLIEENGEEVEEEALNGIQNLGIEEASESVNPPMYLATGYGIDGVGVGGGGGGVHFSPGSFDETDNIEEYYKRMVGEDPCNPLFLRNYAQLLQSKGDLVGAEEYYFRATLADPQDGEILLQYAKLVWNLHHDQDRALSYFERAVEAAPEDSYVLAAYASFLLDTVEDEEEDCAQKDHTQIKEDEDLIEPQNSASEEEKEPVSLALHLAAGLGIDVAGYGGGIDTVNYTAADYGEGDNVEEYYKRMVQENPCSPLFLRNYAQLLHQSKGDLQGAEQYYSRAIQADPEDGETISQYAKLVWELHQDRDIATSYFERAVQATPGDSHVLATYASFLWETEEEHSAHQDHIQVPLFHGEVMTSSSSQLSHQLTAQ
uniref:Tetratricopeptide repeat-like superfamily protein n=1 Tax=Davidia involucrata TaxID=16924 RepID=A0A5B6ZQ94_DAVIN